MSNERPKLAGQTRDRTGSRYATRLRRVGKLPAVIYGHGEDPAHIAIDRDAIEHVLHEGAHLLEVDVAGHKAETCLIKEIQYDFLGDHVIHVDLARVDLSEAVEVSVPIVLVNEDSAVGLKTDGAILEHPLTDLQVRCRADAIPHDIKVDVANLAVGDAVTVADINLPAGVVALNEPETWVASISVTQTEEELEEALEAAPGGETVAEPEVISREGEEEGEGEQPAEAKEKE